MYPLKFDPWLRTMIWGGTKIAAYKGIETEDDHIGESWELSGVEEHQTCVVNGALRGRSITDLVKEYKGRLVGEPAVGSRGADDYEALLDAALASLEGYMCRGCSPDELPAWRA